MANRRVAIRLAMVARGIKSQDRKIKDFSIFEANNLSGVFCNGAPRKGISNLLTSEEMTMLLIARSNSSAKGKMLLKFIQKNIRVALAPIGPHTARNANLR